MFIDTHLHLNSEKYANVNEVIERAKILDVQKFITISTTHLEFEEIRNLTKIENVFGTLGIYPTYDNEFENDFLIQKIKTNLNNKIVGIGECGFNIPFSEGERDLIQQEEIFRRQLELAIETNLPVVVHTRNADLNTYQVLNSYKNKNLKGVIHCFVSDYEFAKKVLDLGFYLSFNRIITYNSAINIHETIKSMPLDRVLFETDAPYLNPGKNRGEVNEPKNIPLIAKHFSELRGENLSKVEEIVFKNSLDLFDKIA